MNKLTVTEFVENFTFDSGSLEYVADIGLEKEYGLAVTGVLTDNGQEFHVLGSVVLDEQNGEPNIEHKGTNFVIPKHRTAANEDEISVLTGKDAVLAMKQLYEQEYGTNHIEFSKDDVEIDPSAM